MPAISFRGQKSTDTNSSPINRRYRPEIDGLRAFAVVAVIINHFNKNILPGGYLGVDIFFVISGYVITSSLFGRTSKGFKDFISGFYERRIKRLVPALSVFVLITSIGLCLFTPSPDFSLRTGLTSLFGLSNLYLLKQSTDYFAQSTQFNVFTHTWSLGVEEQFYILFPFLIWFSGFGRQTKNGARNLFIAVGTLSIASLIGFIYLYQTNQPAAYFLMPSRFWEMASGCLIFIGFKKRASTEQFLEKLPPSLVMALIVAVMYLPISMAQISTITVVTLSSILIASLKKPTAAFKIFTNPKVVYIGLISYSLYLWHWGVLSISRWTIGIHWWSVPFQVALMFGLAVASYQWVETPLRGSSWFGERWKTLLAGISVLVATSLAVLTPRTIARDFFVSIPDTIYPPKYSIEPGIPQQELYCHLPLRIESALQDCLVPRGEIAKSGQIFLLGDSHASNHHWSIDNALQKTGSKFALNTLVEYGFIRYLTGTDGCGNQHICIKDAENVYKTFFRDYFQSGDYLLISIARDRFTVGDFNGSPRKQKHKSLRLLHNRLHALSQIAKNRGAIIVLIGDIPKVCGDGINYAHDILRKGNIKECTTAKSTSLADRKGLNSIFTDVAKDSLSTFFVDPHNELCLDDQCSAVNNNDIVLYSDTSPHFSKDNKDILTDFWSRTFIKLGIAN